MCEVEETVLYVVFKLIKFILKPEAFKEFFAIKNKANCKKQIEIIITKDCKTSWNKLEKLQPHTKHSLFDSV